MDMMVELTPIFYFLVVLDAALAQLVYAMYIDEQHKEKIAGYFLIMDINDLTNERAPFDNARLAVLWGMGFVCIHWPAGEGSSLPKYGVGVTSAIGNFIISAAEEQEEERKTTPSDSRVEYFLKSLISLFKDAKQWKR